MTNSTKDNAFNLTLAIALLGGLTILGALLAYLGCLRYIMSTGCCL
jgi:hypothetical protein